MLSTSLRGPFREADHPRQGFPPKDVAFQNADSGSIGPAEFNRHLDKLLKHIARVLGHLRCELVPPRRGALLHNLAAGTVKTVVRDGHRLLRSRSRFMFMQIRVQACAPASMLLHVTNRVASEPPAEITATCARRYTMPVPTHGSCDEKTPDDETTTGSFRNTPL
jgi:hypothetical protein